MANEIKIKQNFEFWRNSVRTENLPLTEETVTTTSDLCDIKTQIIGTTHEVVAAGDMTDTVMMLVYNLHATATVSIGGDSGGSFVKWIDIAAGDPPAQIPRVGTLATTYLKSTSASTNVRVVLVKIAS
jgi:hypothetical protein